MAGARTWHILIGALWKVIIKNLSNGKQQRAPPADKALESEIREPSAPVLKIQNLSGNFFFYGENAHGLKLSKAAISGASGVADEYAVFMFILCPVGMPVDEHINPVLFEQSEYSVFQPRRTSPSMHHPD